MLSWSSAVCMLCMFKDHMHKNRNAYFNCISKVRENILSTTLCFSTYSFICFLSIVSWLCLFLSYIRSIASVSLCRAGLMDFNLFMSCKSFLFIPLTENFAWCYSLGLQFGLPWSRFFWLLKFHWEIHCCSGGFPFLSVFWFFVCNFQYSLCVYFVF